MKISTNSINTEKIKEDLILASIALMVLDPYKAKHDAIHGDNYFITKEMYEDAKKELYSILETVEKELNPIDAQIIRNSRNGTPIENEESIREYLRRIFAICDYCLSHKENLNN